MAEGAGSVGATACCREAHAGILMACSCAPTLQPIKEVVRPDNQLQLSEKELGEEIARTLTANNPQAPANLARYNFKDRCYRAEPLIDQLLQHLQLEGCLAQRGSEEAARDQQHREAASRRATEVASRRVTEAAGPAHPSEAGEPQAQASSAGGADPKLRNQFNSVDRGAQTGHNVPKDRSTMTEPPPTAEAAGSCTRWEIYDAYVEDHERQRQQEEAAKQRAAVARKGQQAAQLSQARSKDGQQVSQAHTCPQEAAHMVWCRPAICSVQHGGFMGKWSRGAKLS